MFIALKWFAGMIPRRGRQHLPAPHATEAENCNLYSGELRPLKQPALAHQFCKPGEDCWRTPIPDDPSIPPEPPPEPPNCVPVVVTTHPEIGCSDGELCVSPAFWSCAENRCVGDRPYDPSDDIPPVPLYIEGEEITLVIEVEPGYTEPLQIQWLRNNEAIPGAVSTKYTFTIDTDDSYAAYSALVINPCGEEITQEFVMPEVTPVPTEGCDPYACDALNNFLLTQDLVGYWPFDENSGNVSNDAFGNYNLTDFGSATRTNTGWLDECRAPVRIDVHANAGPRNTSVPDVTSYNVAMGFVAGNGSGRVELRIDFNTSGGESKIDFEWSAGQTEFECRIRNRDVRLVFPSISGSHGDLYMVEVSWVMNPGGADGYDVTGRVRCSNGYDNTVSGSYTLSGSGLPTVPGANPKIYWAGTGGGGSGAFQHGWVSSGTHPDWTELLKAYERNFVDYIPPNYCPPGPECQPYACDALQTELANFVAANGDDAVLAAFLIGANLDVSANTFVNDGSGTYNRINASSGHGTLNNGQPAPVFCPELTDDRPLDMNGYPAVNDNQMTHTQTQIIDQWDMVHIARSTDVGGPFAIANVGFKSDSSNSNISGLRLSWMPDLGRVYVEHYGGFDNFNGGDFFEIKEYIQSDDFICTSGSEDWVFIGASVSITDVSYEVTFHSKNGLAGTIFSTVDSNGKTIASQRASGSTLRYRWPSAAAAAELIGSGTDYDGYILHTAGALTNAGSRPIGGSVILTALSRGNVIDFDSWRLAFNRNFIDYLPPAYCPPDE